jgi:hypothetical protein
VRQLFFSFSLHVMVALTHPHVRQITPQTVTVGMQAAGPVTVGLRQIVLRGTRLTATLMEPPKPSARHLEPWWVETALVIALTALVGQQVSFQIVRPFLTLRFSATQSQRTQFT